MVDCPSDEDILSFIKNEAEDNTSLNANHLNSCTNCTIKINVSKKHLNLYQYYQPPQFVSTHENWLNLKEKINIPEKQTSFAKYGNWYALAATILFLSSLFYTYTFFYSSNQYYLHRGIVFDHNKQQINVFEPFLVTKKTSVETPAFATAQLSLSEQILCTLDFSSQMNIVSANKVKLENGSFFFEVTPGTPFQVQTKYGIIQVLGTKFLVNHKDNEVGVTVYEGKVRFTKNSKETIISSGKSFTMSQDNEVTLEENIEEQPKWLDLPLYLATKEEQNLIVIELTNLTSNEIRLPLFSGSTPHLVFHIKMDSNSFETPVFSSNKNVNILPGETSRFYIEKENVFKTAGIYEVVVTFQGKIQKNKSWSGIIRSSAVTMNKK